MSQSNGQPFEFSSFEFSPVILLPATYEVYDFSQGYDAERFRVSEYGIGRYNERRPGMYSTDLFRDAEGARDIHVGIDIAAPLGAPVHAFFDGEIFMVAINPAPGDYGGTIITEHQLGERRIWALHGHLSHASVTRNRAGRRLARGEAFAWLGDRAENGGWNPHLHFQLSWEKPERCDLPGAVNDRMLARALEIYPDPRLVLGPLY